MINFKLNKNKAFTLIELMVVVAVIAILVVTTIPTFISYLKEARRQDAVSAISFNKTLVEQYIMKNKQAPNSSSDIPDFKNISNSNLYDITYTKNNNKHFTITAVAKAGTSQEDDTLDDGTDCSTLFTTSKIDFIKPKNCQ